MAFPRARDASRCRAFQRRFVSKRRGLGTHNTERVTRAPPPCPERGTRTMPKKDKTKAKQQAEDARGAVTEEVSKTVDDAQHAAGGVTSSLKDAVETVAETTTHAMSSVTHAVSSAIDKVCLPFPRARAILAALPPSTLTRRPVIPVSSERPRDTFSRSWDATKYSNRRQSAEALDANKDGKVDARDAAEVGRRCSPAKCIIS